MSMNINWVTLGEIHPYEKNPRQNEDAVQYVANSIKEFGWKQPIVVDKDGVIIAGHTRYKAAKKLGLEKVPVITADDLTEEQVKAYRLADNKTAEIADWDFEKLDEELNKIVDIDMSDFGFESINVLDNSDLVDDNYDEPLPENPKSAPGQVYQLGRHRIMCGDATKREDVMKLTGGEIVDMLLTDPPYGVDYTGKTDKALKIENDNMQDEQLLEFLRDSFENANEVLKEGGVFYIWHASSKTDVFSIACHLAAWKVRQILIWVKNSMVLGRQDYQWKHEPCIYGWKEGAAHLWTSDRKQTNILEFDRPIRNKEHPTMKPVELFDYQIKNNTKEGEKVLDLFAGSGTTIIACEQNGRNAYAMEYDPKHCDVIIDRWERMTGEKAELVEE